jgi:predicted aldo/keto reductase-like oxidoreductase
LPRFAKIAGGHNFHPTVKERYYNWFYHKFVRAYREYGKAQCVACGNCKKNCPAGIKIGEVLKEIVGDYKKSNP